MITKFARKEQKEGIQFISEHRRVLLADSMGSGKTLQTIGVIQNMIYAIPSAKILIIVPSSLGQHWIAEFNKWTPEIKKILIYAGFQPVEYSLYNVYIISYGLILPGRVKYLEISPIKWNFVIADESHAFRNRETLTAMYIAPILKKADKVLLISGTPQTSRPEQLFVQYDILFPNEMSFETFAMTYCNGKLDKKTGKLVARGYSNLDLLNRKLNTVMLRRNDPNMKPVLVRIKVSFQVQKSPLYLALQTKLASLASTSKGQGVQGGIGGGIGGGIKELTDIVAKMYLETGNIKSKNPQIIQFIIDLVKRNYNLTGHKTLIFAHHDIVRQRVSDALLMSGIKHNSIDGSVPAIQRLGLVNEVANMNSNTICSVCSITACSTGLSFVPGVNVIIFLEYTWNIADQLQAEARVARYGANVPTVYAYYIHCGALYDRRLLMNLKEKYLVNNQTMDNKKYNNPDIKSIKDIGGIDTKIENSEGQFAMSREIEYKPGSFTIDKFTKDTGKTELDELKNLQKELKTIGSLSLKDLNAIEGTLNGIELPKNEYDQ